jgi:CarD family transcriptional regulator
MYSRWVIPRLQDHVAGVPRGLDRCADRIGPSEAMATAKKKVSAPRKRAAARNAKPKTPKKAAAKKAAAMNAQSKTPKKPAAQKKAAATKPAAKKTAPKAKAAPARPPVPKKPAVQPKAKPVVPEPVAPKAPAESKEKTKKVVKADKPRGKLPFSVNDFVVYPTHGVGKITAIEEQVIAGIELEMFVVEFEKDKMILRVPVTKVDTSGMRKLASPNVMEEALTTLKGRARVKRTMWSRRAQEYEAKINSGDPVAIAEVVRDLHRNANQPEQSYSERQIYEAALDRLVREVAAVEKIDEDAAQERLQKVLQAA